MNVNSAVRNFIGQHEDKDRTTVLVVGGMHCAACVGRVEKALRARPGVETAGVNLLTRLATVRHTHQVKPQELVEAVGDIGYQATLASPAGSAHARVSFGDTMDVIASRKTRFVVGAIFTLLILIIDQAQDIGRNQSLWQAGNLGNIANERKQHRAIVIGQGEKAPAERYEIAPFRIRRQFFLMSHAFHGDHLSALPTGLLTATGYPVRGSMDFQALTTRPVQLSLCAVSVAPSPGADRSRPSP